jgi:hypothetical protein
MNYLRISNEGLICQEDLMLIGSSTKREQSGKIGMFGSGWKYALAWLLRNDCKPIIFAGEKQIDIDFNVKMHRTNAVNVITVDGIETSLTTEMGPKWTGWMAIREVLSNAIDEGGHTINTIWAPSGFSGVRDETVVYIPMNGELSDVMLKYDSYFAFNRRESYSNSLCRMFFKTEPSQLNIYRKGIRCFDTQVTSGIDFDFVDININEDRLTQSYQIAYKIHDILNQGIPVNIFKKILEEEQISWLPSSMNDVIMANINELINSGHTFTTETLQKLGGLLFSSANALVIPANWYKKLQDLGLVKSPFEFLNSNESFIRTDEKNIKGIIYHLKAMNVDLPVKSGKCESHCFVHNGQAYVRDDTNLSDKEIAAGIIKRMDESHLMEFM